jgi:hypothetical protein
MGSAVAIFSSVPRSESVFLVREEPVPSLPLNFWNERPTLDGLDLRVRERSLLSTATPRDENPGTNLPTSGFSEGAQAQTIPRFISIAAQYMGGADQYDWSSGLCARS